MGILNRIRTILRANINDVLDQAEDPEKMLAQMERDFSEALKEARASVTEALVQLKMSESELSEAERLSQEWQRKAELAARQRAADLVRECFVRKRDYDRNVELLTAQVTTQRQAVARLRSDQTLLESRAAQMQRIRSERQSRFRAARAERDAHKKMAELSITDPDSSLRRIDDKLRRLEAEASAARDMGSDSLERRLAALEDGDIDFEIEAQVIELMTRSEQGKLTDGR